MLIQGQKILNRFLSVVVLLINCMNMFLISWWLSFSRAMQYPHKLWVKSYNNMFKNDTFWLKYDARSTWLIVAQWSGSFFGTTPLLAPFPWGPNGEQFDSKPGFCQKMFPHVNVRSK